MIDFFLIFPLVKSNEQTNKLLVANSLAAND